MRTVPVGTTPVALTLTSMVPVRPTYMKSFCPITVGVAFCTTSVAVPVAGLTNALPE